jgi:hypothetical protein
MTRKERLMSTLAGKTVDRPPVCFYELNGLDENPRDPDPFNIYNHPDWAPLLRLAAEHSDRIVMRPAAFRFGSPEIPPELASESIEKNHRTVSTYTRIQAGGRTLCCCTRRDADVNTVWTLEHLLKSPEDAEAYLTLPLPEQVGEPDTAAVLSAEEALGDTGIVMLDTPDPLCRAAGLFGMEDFTIIALTEPDLFRRLLDRFAAILYPRIEAYARALPGRLWRIYGPEYAAPPYLPPALFRDYATAYDTALVDIIHRFGGYARLHSHGRIKDVLPFIAATGCDGLDPIEPVPQGDADLAWVRREYGGQMVLFGNIEASEISLLDPAAFRARVRQALRDGTAGRGRGFVLMPSAIPYSRELPPFALENYAIMIAEAGLL